MNKLLVVLLILIISILGILTVRKSNKSRHSENSKLRPETYESSQELENEARVAQRNFLPSANDLTELGGKYETIAGIETPSQSYTSDNPWLTPTVKGIPANVY